MDLGKIHNVYFIGIGGIGMSAIARYFNKMGKHVAGYDKVSKPLTNELIHEGILVHFDDDVQQIPSQFKNKENTLVVYTPAIPKNHKGMSFFMSQGFELKKRSEVLGMLTAANRSIAVAGTHGKTTVSTMIAHLMRQSRIGCNAFLGGISKNYKTNLLVDPDSKYMVVEADEFDRSFLKLFPQKAVVTAVDADHLDIYETKANVEESFRQFIQQMNTGGTLLIKQGLKFKLPERNDLKVYTYSIKEKADFFAENIRIENGLYRFDFVGIDIRMHFRHLTIPGLLNVENAVAAIAIAYLSGVKDDEIANSLEKFKGIQRRFDYQILRDDLVYIDDYAHHPEELKAVISSTKELFKGKKITGIFQPHLFTRTRDFATEFAESLSLLDELILLDIYPARELPIAGVTSEIIFKNVTCKSKLLCSKSELPGVLKTKKFEVLMTLGAGDIDEFVEPIKKMFS